MMIAQSSPFDNLKRLGEMAERSRRQSGMPQRHRPATGSARARRFCSSQAYELIPPVAPFCVRFPQSHMRGRK